MFCILFSCYTLTQASGKPSFIREELFRKCLWSPHFLFVNLHSSEDLHLSRTPNVFMVDGDSTIMSVTYAVVTVGCNMRFNMYPFDYQVPFLLLLSLFCIWQDVTLLLLLLLLLLFLVTAVFLLKLLFYHYY